MDFPIRRGSSQNPYQEYTFVLPANGKRIINDVYNFFVLLSQSVSNSLSVRFGDNGRITNLSREAINLNFTEVFERIEFINRTASSVTVTIALGIGMIVDTRLAGNAAAGAVSVTGVSGTVSIAGSVSGGGGYFDSISTIGSISSIVQTQLSHPGIYAAKYTVDDATPTQICLGDDRSKRLLIYGNQNFYIGDSSEVSADTAFLQKTSFPPMELWNSGKIYAKHPSGSGLTDTIYVIEERV